jgi:hypothetical protein
MPVANRIVRPPCPLAGRGLLSLSPSLWKLVSLTGTLNFSHGLLVCLPRTHLAAQLAVGGSALATPRTHFRSHWCACPGRTQQHNWLLVGLPWLHHTLTLLNTTHGGRCNSSSRGRSSSGGCSTTPGRCWSFASMANSRLLCGCWVNGAVPLDRYATTVVVLAVQYRTTPTLLL